MNGTSVTAVAGSSDANVRSVRCLGVLELRLDGVALPLSKQHSRLFAALAAAGREGMDTDQLLDELYGEDVPRSGNQAIYSLVSRLDDRASSFLVNKQGRYRLHTDDVDAWELLDESDDPADLARTLRRWRGAPFTGIEGGPIIDAVTAVLGRRRSAVAEKICRLADADQLRDIEQQIRAAVDDDPYNEPLAISVASAQFRLRKRRDALSIIQTCRANLRTDLGLDGSAELDAAELALLEEQDPLARSAGASADVWQSTTVLPGLLTPRAATFAGREAELKAMESVQTDSTVDRRGRIIVITGAAGMGKTELVSQLAARMQHTTIRVGGAGPTTSAAYGAWVRALPEIADDVDALARSSDPGAARLSLWHAVERALAELALRGPVLVVLEDVHDADDQAASLFGWLATGSLPSGVLIIATTRPPPAGTLWNDTLASIRRTATLGVATMIDLQPLELDAIESMVACRFPSEPAARIHRFSRQVHALAHGNPLVGSALIAEADGPDDLVTSTTMTVEDQHAQSVLKRVDGVVAGVLTNAGLIGTDFDLAALAELCEMSPSATLVHLETAMAAGLVIETDELGRFRFDHVLSAEAFAQRASRTRRSQTYVKLAEAEGVAPADRVRYIRGAGAMLATDTAIELLLQESEKLSSAHAFGEAQAALEHAGELATLSGEQPTFELLVRLAEATARAGDFARLQDYRLRAFEAGTDARSMARAALVGLPASERAQGDPELVKLLQRIDMHELEDPMERGVYLHQFVRAARLAERTELVPEIFDQVSRADISSDEMWAVLESERIVIDSLSRHLPDAPKTLDELIANLPPGIIRTQLLHRAFLTSLTAQEPDASTRRLDAARSAALDQPVPRMRWALELADVTLTQVGILDSKTDGASALSTGFRLGISDAFDAYGAQAWQQLWIDERFGDALALLDGARGMISPNVGWLCAEGFAAAAAGEMERALTALSAGAEQLRAKPAGTWALAAAALTVEAADHIDLPEAIVRTAVDVLRPHSGSAIVLGVCAAYFGPADGFIARGLKTLGDADANGYFDAARSQLERTGSTYWMRKIEPNG